MRFLLAVAALPLAVSLIPFMGDVFGALAFRDAETFLSPRLWSAFAGFLLFLGLWVFLPVRPVRLYVLGHELTHAAFGLLFGARPSNLRVSLKGGSVSLTKTNVLITLAPYFFPFYTMLVVLAALVTRLFVSPPPAPALWLFAVGFTWCFHLCFTLQALMGRQPDVLEYGRLFSWVFIWVFNVLGVAVWLVVTLGMSVSGTFALFVARAGAAYGGVARLCRCALASFS